MIDFRNPYTPGAGVMPKYLAGREELLGAAELRLKSVAAGYQARSVAYYGLRGVGKTVILNAIESIAENENVLVRHIEVQEKKGFAKALAAASNAFTLNLSSRERMKDKFERLKSVVASFSATWNPEDNTVSFGLDENRFAAAVAGTGDITNDLTELLVALGKYAQEAQASVCFCIDELQYAKNDELEGLIAALHRCAQLNLPVLVFCAGLPKLLKSMSEAKTYSERLFEFVEVGSLDGEAARKAIVEPAEKLDVRYEDEAVEKILSFTEGYPYFIQELCSTIWQLGDGNNVTPEMVDKALVETAERLDQGFFSVRYNRCTECEQRFMFAMLDCGELPCTISNVAHNMGRTVSQVSPFRAKLISKGLIYSTGYGEIDFTVPQFDKFLERERMRG